jgi:hypothetical protein
MKTHEGLLGTIGWCIEMVIVIYLTLGWTTRTMKLKEWILSVMLGFF